MANMEVEAKHKELQGIAMHRIHVVHTIKVVHAVGYNLDLVLLK
jgi:hypothetical protein